MNIFQNPVSQATIIMAPLRADLLNLMASSSISMQFYAVVTQKAAELVPLGLESNNSISVTATFSWVSTGNSSSVNLTEQVIFEPESPVSYATSNFLFSRLALLYPSFYNVI